MAAIDPALIQRLQTKLGLSRAQVYRRIEQIVNALKVPRQHAAIVLASQSGINIARFATPDDLAAIRQATSPGAVAKVSPLQGPSVSARPVPPSRGARRRPRPAPRQRGTSVWVVHGRNVRAADELRRLLRAVGLRPLEWNQAVAKTREGSPYVGTILERAFQAAAAVVVLMTPDDEARLRAPYRRAGDPTHETRLTGQARANVLFEAGMAFGRNANSTVIVQLGRVRPFSDAAGRHVVHLDNSAERRRELATKLANAGCDVDLSGLDWLSEGDFSLDDRRTRPRGARRRTRAERPRRRR